MRRRKQSGSAMFELAVGVAILSAAFTGTFEFGYIFYQYDNLMTAVENGAHYAAVRTWDSTDGAMTTAYKTSVQYEVLYGDPTGTTNVIQMTGLTKDNIVVTPNGGSGSLNVPDSVTVSITGYTINSIFGTMACNGKPSVTYPFQGFVTDGF